MGCINLIQHLSALIVCSYILIAPTWASTVSVKASIKTSTALQISEIQNNGNDETKKYFQARGTKNAAVSLSSKNTDIQALDKSGVLKFSIPSNARATKPIYISIDYQ